MKNLMSDMSQQRSNIKFHSSVIYDSIIPLINDQCHRQNADYTVLHIRMIVHLGHVH